MPSGIKLESVPGAPVAGALLDGTLLYSTGSFGADELSTRKPDGSFTLFAAGFGSLAGVAQSELDGHLAVGDSFGAVALWELVDLNLDGDALDAGEMVPAAVQPPVFSGGSAALPFDLVFRPGTNDLYMSGSTPFGVEPFQGGLVRFVGASAEILLDDLGFASGMVFDGDQLYLGDIAADFSSGRVLSMDVAGAGVTPVVFAGGLSGSSGLVRASDGNIYVSGTTDLLSGDFSGCVTRLAPDGDNDGASDEITPCVIDGFSFAGALTLVERPGGFVPGAGGDGVLYVGDFTLAGARRFSSAPLAATSVDGVVGPNSQVTLTVSGAPGAAGFVALSLDTTGITVPGVGDLCLGFAGISVLTGMKTLDRTGQADFEILFRGLPGLIGQELAIQGFTLEADEFGLGNGLHFVFGN